MKKTFNILMLLSIIVMLTSCEDKDEFLNKEPLGEYSEIAVWSDPVLIQTFVNSMYRDVMGFPFAVIRLSDFSDESILSWDWGVRNFNKCLINPDDLAGWDPGWDASPQQAHLRWGPLYGNVRRANIFFSKINSVQANQASIDNLKGQVYFLRAFTYFKLTTLFGSVPIITKVYTLNDEYDVPRNTYEECINFMVGQLDSAVMYLGDSYPTDGHVSKGAAMALKARLLLYAASDLHNPAKNSALVSGYTNPELIGYTGGDASARWTAAKNAAKAVIDLNRYSLYKATPAPGDSVAQNFVELFTSKGSSEDILLQFFTPKTEEGSWNNGYNPGYYVQPNGYHCWGASAPLGDLVDGFEMKDGSMFNWNNPIHKANPYINREARFYATVLYEGVQWRPRPADGLAIDPYSRIQTGRVYNLSGTMIKAGLDTRQGPIEDWNGSLSGYYLRKYVDPTLDPQYVKQDIPFKHFRYGEILLNYAEACIELGQDAEARTYINMIRKRAGQPDLSASLTGDALRQAYRHERRIELAYEDQRFWDIRRWMIGPEAYRQTSSVDIRYVTSVSVTSYRQPDGSTWGAPTYSKINTPGDARAWIDKCYFFPIMRAEMNKNTKLIQNPGY